MITGAGSGLGLEFVQHLLRVPKCRIIACGRSESRLQELFGSYPEISISALDLEWSDSKISETIQNAFRFHGALDILINCAGVGFRGLVVETTSEVDRKVMQVDYFGQISVVKGVLTANQAEGFHQCHIIQISSVQGYFGLGERAPYSAAKHALVGWIDSLRSEVDSLDHRSKCVVTLVSPGYIATNHSCNALTGDGTSYAQNDETTVGGWSPQHVASRTLLDAALGKREIILADVKVKFLLLIRSLFPELCFRLIRNRFQKSRQSNLSCIVRWLIGCNM
jgi:dehydrogenase/reductase SDR family protein 7B